MANLLAVISMIVEMWVDVNTIFVEMWYKQDMAQTTPIRRKNQPAPDVARYADMLAAMGAEPRLRIMQLLLTAHPEGMVVGELHRALRIPNSTLSHHLEKLKQEGLLTVQRESAFLRCRANTQALQELLGFLYAECCTRSKAIQPETIVTLRK